MGRGPRQCSGTAHAIWSSVTPLEECCGRADFSPQAASGTGYRQWQRMSSSLACFDSTLRSSQSAVGLCVLLAARVTRCIVVECLTFHTLRHHQGHRHRHRRRRRRHPRRRRHRRHPVQPVFSSRVQDSSPTMHIAGKLPRRKSAADFVSLIVRAQVPYISRINVT